MNRVLKYNIFLESLNSNIINKVEFPEIPNLESFTTVLHDEEIQYKIRKFFFPENVNKKYISNRNNHKSDIGNFTIDYYYLTEIIIDVSRDDVKILENVQQIVNNFKIDLDDKFTNVEYFIYPHNHFIYILSNETMPVKKWYQKFFVDIEEVLKDYSLDPKYLKNIDDRIVFRYPKTDDKHKMAVAQDAINRFRFDSSMTDLRKKWNCETVWIKGPDESIGYEFCLVIKTT